MSALVLFALLFCSVFQVNAQSEASTAENKKDTPRSDLFKMMEDISFLKIELDESEKAVFKSGTGEYVEFYPIAITDLKTGKYAQGLKIVTEYDLQGGKLGGVLSMSKEANIKQVDVGYLDLTEVQELVDFFEKYVNPNLDSDMAKKNTTHYIYSSKEITVRLIISKDRNKTEELFEVLMNDRPFMNKFFWTKSQVKNIEEVVKTLKFVTEKAATKGGSTD